MSPISGLQLNSPKELAVVVIFFDADCTNNILAIAMMTLI